MTPGIEGEYETLPQHAGRPARYVWLCFDRYVNGCEMIFIVFIA